MTKTKQYSAEQIADLEARLLEAEDTLDAIRKGSIDALVVKDNSVGEQIYTLKSADYTYRVLIESMSQGALTLSEDGTILYSNRQFSLMVESPLERIIGRNVSTFIHEDDLPIIKTILKRISPKVLNSERTVRLKGKSHKEVLISARKLPVSNDNAFMCLVVTDMTERRRAELAKDEFISLASHQLRTPATGVKQYIGMLLEGYAGELTMDQKAFAQTAFDSNERQLAIINSILKTAQIDFGAYELKIAKQDMRVLIEDTLNAFKPMLGMRRQNVDCQFEENTCAMVEPVEISLVIANLIENASKYSPEGGQISIKLHKDNEQIVVAISDDGVGIEEENHDKIFEKFTRVDNVLSDTVTGSGLGLYWVKKIVELHEGEIHLASMINIGSTFTIRLRSC